MRNSLALLRWLANRSGQQCIFEQQPTESALQLCAAHYEVADLTRIYNGLARPPSRFGRLGSTPMISLRVRHHSYTPPTSGPVPLQFVIIEGKCGVRGHVMSDAMRGLESPDSCTLFADSAIPLPRFVAEVTALTSPQHEPSGGRGSSRDEEEE